MNQFRSSPEMSGQQGPPPVPSRAQSRPTPSFYQQPPPPPNSYQSPYLFNNPQPPSFHQPFAPYSYNRPPFSGMNGLPPSQPPGGDIASLGMLQSLESVVCAISSMSALIESSYWAVGNSLRALISLGENFSNLRSEIIGIIRSLSILRGVKWVVEKILCFLRLRDPRSIHDAWSDSKRTPPYREKPPHKWSSIAFFVFLFGGPWLLYKLMKQAVEEQQALTRQPWMTGEGPHYVVKALYPFSGTNSDELSVKRGDKLLVSTSKDHGSRVVPRGWVLATIDGAKSGLVPANHLQLVADNKDAQPPSSTPQFTVGTESSDIFQ